MQKILLNIALLLACVFVLPVASPARSSLNITWHGYLIDTESGQIACKAGNALNILENYDRQTALRAKSQAVGYMIFAVKWYHLDKHGNELAIEAIKRSAKMKGFYVAVSGKLQGDTLVVEALDNAS